jgi:hypothetical protein
LECAIEEEGYELSGGGWGVARRGMVGEVVGILVVVSCSLGSYRMSDDQVERRTSRVKGNDELWVREDRFNTG